MIHWRVLFYSPAIKRGKEYYESGRVSDFSFSEKKITATVRGTKDYSVTIYLDDGEVENMECTCPHAADGHCCKHMAAVLVAYDTAVEEWPEKNF